MSNQIRGHGRLGTVLGRRATMAVLLSGLAAPSIACAAAGGPAPVRLGTLQFGTVQWIADIIARHHLDTAHDFALRTVTLANTDAGRVALMARAADIVVSDWLFVATARAGGTRLRFAPFSATLGGVMVPADSPVRSLADLAGRRLGVAGGPTDKSWIVVQAAARARPSGPDLAATARVVYGAPPLLSAKLQQGQLDAVLTFWTFAARLEATGYRELVSVADCARTLGLPARLALVGFVFHEDWAARQGPAITGFLAAVESAQQLLQQSEAEWRAIRPLMDAPDQRLFQALRRRFLAGIIHPDPAAEQQAASRLFQVLLQIGGARATGGLAALPPGIFWPPADEAG